MCSFVLRLHYNAFGRLSKRLLQLLLLLSGGDDLFVWDEIPYV